MVRERWLADGWELTDGAVRDVEVRDNLYATPATRGEDSLVAGRHGRLWRPRKLDAGAFGMTLWLGANTRAELEAAYDELLRRTVAVQHRLVTWTRHLADGTVREAQGYVSDTVDPAPIGQLGMRLSLAVVIPSGSWRDAADSTLLEDVLAEHPQPHVLLGTAARATAPLDELVYVLRGPSTTPRLTDPATGEYVELGQALAGGQLWRVDAAAWTSTVDGVDARAVTRWTGARMLELVPDGANTPRVTYTSAGGETFATLLTITGRSRYLA